MIANPESLWLDDPESRLYSFGRQRAYRAVEALQHRLDGLISWSQHDDSGRAAGIVATRVSEIGVERDENPPLAFASILNRLVERRAEPFLMDIMDIPAARFKWRAGEPRHVLVELEAHALRGNGYDPLVRELGCEGERRWNMLRTDGRILGKDGVHSLTRGEVVENHVHGNARAAQARGPVHAFRVNRDVCAPIHRILRSTYLNVLECRSARITSDATA